MQSINDLVYNKISFVMTVCLSVCLFVCLGPSCVRKSQATLTKHGKEAQNLKCEVEFVCGTNRILTSVFMLPSRNLAYYSKIVVTRNVES
jgi:hypothetical protein